MNRRSLIAAASALTITPTVFSATPEATSENSGAPNEAPFFKSASIRLGEMISYLPASLLTIKSAEVSWMDLERQRAAFGGISTEGNVNMTMPVSIPDNMMAYAREFENVFGFALDDIRETVVAGIAPTVVRVYRVGVETSVIEAALEDSEYTLKETRGLPFWTIGEDFEADLSHPVQRMFLAAANNIALLDDGVVAFAPSSRLLADVMAASAGERNSILTEMESELANLPQDAANAYIGDSTFIRLDGTSVADHLAESDDAVGPMPHVIRIGCGVTAGAHYDMAEQLPAAKAWALVTTDGESKQAAEVIAWRLENMVSPASGQTYRDFIGETTVVPLDDDAVLVTAEGDAVSRNVFMQMLFRADAGPFYPSGEN